MAVSYNGLWKLLIDKNMKKVDLMNQVEYSAGLTSKYRILISFWQR